MQMLLRKVGLFCVGFLALLVTACAGTVAQESLGLPGDSVLKKMLDIGGITTVVLVFQYLMFRYFVKLFIQLLSSTNQALNNNTNALAGLMATMQTGCPLVRESHRRE